MKKTILLTCLTFMLCSIHAQTLSRQVISSFGGFSNVDQIFWLYTGGQTEYTTTESDSIILTQGFEQPDEKKSITYQEIIPECDNGNGITLVVDVLEMCGSYSSSVLLNSLPVDPVIENVTPGSYELEVICGGTNYHSIAIEVLALEIPTCELVFYSGIVPNGMDENQIWFIENIDLYPENEVEIFDRWGNSIWNGINYNNSTTKWEGDNRQGEELPQGTYYYIFKTGQLAYKGFIEIIR